MAEEVKATPEYPQKEMQSDASLRTMLFKQAEALFPAESVMLQAYKLPSKSRILDVGCGCGEIAKRVALLFPEADVLGIDLEERNIKQANALRAQQADNVQKRLHFQTGNAFSLTATLPEDAFDLVLCRSMLYAVKKPELVIAQILKVVKKSANTLSLLGRDKSHASRGVVHLMVEDMGGVHYSPACSGGVMFWIDGVSACFTNTGTDPFCGRGLYPLLYGALSDFIGQPLKSDKADEKSKAATSPLHSIRVQYLIADTCSVARSTLAQIFRTWKDGYAEMIAKNTRYSVDEVTRFHDDLIDCTLNEAGFASWQNYVCSVEL